jgi:hypothetical protein
MHMILQHLNDIGLELEDDMDKKHAEIIFQQSTPLHEIMSELAVAIEGLWKSPNVVPRIRRAGKMPRIIDSVS